MRNTWPINDGWNLGSELTMTAITEWCMRRPCLAIAAFAAMNVMLTSLSTSSLEGFEFFQGSRIYKNLEPELLELPTCSIEPSFCSFQKSSKPMTQQVLAAAKMHRSIWNMGGSAVALCCTASFLLGLLLQFQLWKSQSSAPNAPASGVADGASAIDRWLSWWCFPFQLTYPTLSMKLWVFALLWIHCHALMLPRSGVLATPELVEMVPRIEAGPMLPWNLWLLPNLTAETASSWKDYLCQKRSQMILSWCGFILLPSNSPKDPLLQSFLQLSNGLLYASGAVIYAYFGTITYTYNRKHSEYCTILFSLMATTAVPFLETNPRAAAWLRKFLIMCAIIPIYLFAGVCKVRYLGVHSLLITGHWFSVGVIDRSHGFAWIKGINEYLSTCPWLALFISWFTMAFELLVPVLCIASTRRRTPESWIWRCYFLGTVLFHVQVFFQLGPNWIVQILLLLLACDPLRCFKLQASAQENSGPRSAELCCGDRLRAAVGFLTLLGWFIPQFSSDLDRLFGRFPWTKNYEPFLPFPEVDMFTPAGKASGYRTPFVLVSLLAVLLIAKIRSDVTPSSLTRDLSAIAGVKP
eukprot:s56_g36.t1